MKSEFCKINRTEKTERGRYIPSTLGARLKANRLGGC